MAGHIADPTSNQWCTPKEDVPLIEAALGEVHLDPCSNPHSHVKAAYNYILPNNDGLVDPWDISPFTHTNVFCNPPFGKAWRLKGLDGKYTYFDVKARKELPKDQKALLEPVHIDTWINRALYHYMERRCSVILLIPAYPGTAIWQNVIHPFARAICYPKGRLAFDLPPQKCTLFECEVQAVWKSESTLMCNMHKNLLDGKVSKIKGPAPMDCAYVYFGHYPFDFYHAFHGRGYTYLIR